MDGFAVADLERALYAERTLVKHMAMRRTLCVFPRATLARRAGGGASDRVAGAERRRLVKDVEEGGLHADGAALARRRLRRGARGARGRARG